MSHFLAPLFSRTQVSRNPQILAFLDLLSRLAADNDFDLTDEDRTLLLGFLADLIKSNVSFDEEFENVVCNHASSQPNAAYSDMLRLICHAMAIADRNRMDGKKLLMRILGTMTQNGCDEYMVDHLLSALNDSRTKSHVTAFLLTHFDSAGCVSSIIRMYQNTFTFLLAEALETEEAEEIDDGIATKPIQHRLMLPIGAIEAFTKVMRFFNPLATQAPVSTARVTRENDLDDACAIWNGILRVISTTIDYYKVLINSDVSQMEAFKGIEFNRFEEARSRAEKLLAVLDHVRDEILDNFVLKLLQFSCPELGGNASAMLAQICTYARNISSHYNDDSDNPRTQRCLKDRICFAVASSCDA